METELLDRANELLAELSSQLDGQSCQLGPLNLCNLDYEEVELAIEFTPATGRMAVYSELAESVESFDVTVLQQWVEANFLGADTGGATLFVDPETLALWIGIGLPVEALDCQRLQSILLGMVDQVRRWKLQITSDGATAVTPVAMSANQLFV